MDLKGRNGTIFGVILGAVLYLPMALVFIVLLGLGGSLWGQL